MATSIREAILDRVVTQLATITTGNGFEQTIARVHRPQTAILQVEQFPCIIVRDLGDESRWHLRDAMENTMSLELVGYVEKGDDNARLEALSDIAADIVKLVQTDETWNSNARRTWTTGTTPSVNEYNLFATVVVGVKILYRVVRANPYATKAV